MSGILDQLVTYLSAGGWVMPPLAAVGAVLWFVIGYRHLLLRRYEDTDVRTLVDERLGGAPGEPRGLIGAAVVEAVALARQGRRDLRRCLDECLAPYEEEARRFAPLVVALVAVAPLLGLLGTVVGMIEAFRSIGDLSLHSQTGGIAGGISQALFTTQLGLAIAIPGLVLKELLERRQRALETDLARLKDILCAR